MIRAGYLVAMILLGGLDCFAQEDVEEYRYSLEQDKSRFEKVMDSETSVNNKKLTDSMKLLHTYYLLPQKLPEWLFRPAEFASSNVFFIGISDPGMDSIRAVELAVLRAKALIVLSRDTRIDNVTDNFIVTREMRHKEDQASKYLDFTRVAARKTLTPESFSTDKVCYTKYGEGIALVSYNPSSITTKDTLNVKGDFMQLIREGQYGLDNTMFCTFQVRQHRYSPAEDSVLTEYVYKGRDKRFNLFTSFQGDTIQFPAHPYKYRNSQETEKDSSLFINSSLSVGLWNAYINALFANVSYFNRNLSGRVKSSYDNYSMKNQGIIRTVSRNNLSFFLDHLVIEDNEMYITLNFSKTD